jgi:hypothetical protein
MSLQDYISQLSFGSTADSINAMKNQALEQFSNPLELQYESLQSKIGQITGTMAGISDDGDEIMDKVVGGITSALGMGLESGGVAVGMRSFFQTVKNKFKNPTSTTETAGNQATTNPAKGGGVKKTAFNESKEGPDSAKGKSEVEGKSDEPDGPDPEAAESAPYKPEGGETKEQTGGETKEDIPEPENEDMFEGPSFKGGTQGGEFEMQEMGSSNKPSMEGVEADAGSEIEMKDMGANNKPSMEGDEADDLQDFGKAPSAQGGEFEMADMGSTQPSMEGADVLENVVQDATTGVEEGASDIFGSISDAISNFGRSAISNLGNLFGGGGEAVTSGISSLSDVVTSGISGFASGGIQGAISGVSKAVSTATSAATDAVAGATDAVAGATDAVTGAVAGVTGAAEAGVAAATGAAEGITAAATAGVEAGVIAAGGALEAVPVIGQILGTLLMVGGAIFGGVEAGEEAETDTAKATDEEKISADEVAEAQVKTQELTEQQKLTNMQFTGSNVIGSLSSIFNQGTTATAF